MSDVKQRILDAMETCGISVKPTFVPWKDTPEGKATKPSFAALKLNWMVEIVVAGKPVLTTPYMAGVAHCPSYSKGHKTVDDLERLTRECNTGRMEIGRRGPILPDAVDVLVCLLSDASAIDSGSFEDWASDYGLDTDSRKAEAQYKACLETGLKLRAALGDDGLKALQDAARDY